MSHTERPSESFRSVQWDNPYSPWPGGLGAPNGTGTGTGTGTNAHHHHHRPRPRSHQKHEFQTQETFPDLSLDVESMERRMENTFRQLGFPRAGLPSLDFSFFRPSPAPVMAFASDDAEREVEPDEGRYSVDVPLGRSIRPEDVKVSVADGVMTVEAEKDVTSRDGRSHWHQEHMSRFRLPEKVDENEVKSFLTPSGELHVEAPLPRRPPRQPQPQLQLQRRLPQEIPIEFGYDLLDEEEEDKGHHD